MAIDLFRDDLTSASNAELFAAIKAFAETMPSEGWRHEYTREWQDSALKDVAAFANTFGGLLIVGVKKDKGDHECVLVGAESDFEYKTRIASSIAANISPVPGYRIYECHQPEEPKRRFCVIRVEAGQPLHLITKKGMEPTHIRNEDQTRPANAAELRHLIEREREAPELGERQAEKAHELLTYLHIGRSYKSDHPHTWQTSLSSNSQTFLKLALIPNEKLYVEMEKSHEDEFLRLVEHLYTRIHDAKAVALTSTERGTDYYQRSWYHSNLDHEERWRVTGAGAIGHVTEMERSGQWSIVDLAFYIILFTRLSLRWWESIGYRGNGRLYLRINLPGLKVHRSVEGWYACIFDPAFYRGSAFGRRDIRKDAIILGQSPRDAANAEIGFSYFADEDELIRLTTAIMNQLLRSLGHVVAWPLLEKGIRSIIFKAN